MDRISPDKRSKIMSKIRAKNSSPELLLRKELTKAGLKGYRIHYKLPGRPDIVFTKKRVIVFVDGDFWHGFLWKKMNKVPPKQYWQEKIKGNMRRDKKVTKLLRKDGWLVYRVWEHQVIKNANQEVSKINKLLIARN
jgi:DNA mismatch endonuclease (patch repair protein)